MNADSYYRIGAGHTICQDFATHGEVGDFIYVMGADGCSGSKKSELGARLLCESARKVLETNGGQMALNSFQRFLLSEINQLKNLLRLDGSAFDATFWLILACPSYYHVYGWGDGVVHKVFKNGTTSTEKIEFTQGAPFYLSYSLEPSRMSVYLEQMATQEIIQTTFLDGKDPLNEPHPQSRVYMSGGKTEDLKSISIFSDGVNTFKTREGNDLLPVEQIVTEMTAYKNTVGRFVERRMNRMESDNTKADIIHFDDVFCGTIVS